MAVSPPFWAVWTDVLWCLGIGLCIAAGRSALELLFGESRFAGLILDLLSFAAAAVAVCGFAAELSASGTARWYMAAAMGTGALGWQITAAPVLQRGMHFLLKMLAMPLRWSEKRIAGPVKAWLCRKISGIVQRAKEHKRLKKRKKQKKMLQNAKRILYN